MTRRDEKDLELARPGWIGATWLVLGLILLHPTGARAQGFGIYEQSACAMGRGGAAVAAPCRDGSSVFYNPAAIAGADGLTLGLGGLAIRPNGGFTADADGSTTAMSDRAIPVGHLYATFPLWTRFAGGVGIYAPYGLRTKWPSDFAGRFVGYDNKLQTLYVQGTVAARPTDWLSLGVGPIVALSSVQLNRRLDLANQSVPSDLGAPAGSTFGDMGVPGGTDFVDARVDSDESSGYGLAAGVLLRPHPRLSLGARYLTKVTVEYQGFAAFGPIDTGLELPDGNALGLPAGTSVDSLLEASGLFLDEGPFSGQEVTATVDLPAQVVAGVSVEPVDGLLLAADYQRTFWSEVDRVPLDFSNEDTPDEVLILRYRDTGTFHLGAEYRVLSALTIRGGYVHNQAASPATSVTPLLPEAARNQMTAGLGWDASDQVRLDVAYQYVSQKDRRGRVRNPAPGQDPTTALNEGVYSFDGQLLSATLSWAFR